MAPINSLSVLAFASAVLAVPHAQWQPFKRHAHPAAPAYEPPTYGSSSAAPVSSSYDPAAYGSSSSAAPVSSSYVPGAYGSSSSAAPVSSSYEPSAYGSSSSVAAVSSYSSYSCDGRFCGSSAPYSSEASAVPSTSVGTETDTTIYGSTTEYSTYYVTHTIYATKPASAVVPVSYSAPPADPSEAAPASAPDTWGHAASCVPDVTVTTTEKTTVYVTMGASSAGAIPSSAGAAPSYAPPDKGYSKPAPIPSSYFATPSAAAPVPSSYAAPSAPAPSGGSSYSGKRGLAYNDASLCDAFAGSSAASWAYNWGSDSGGLDSSIPYIPMLWGPASQFSGDWAAKAKAAIAGGAEYLFSFNEPDMSSQANLSPEAAAEAWKTYMEPFAGQAKLVAPSVTNGQGPGVGADWLQQFLSACSGCTIDAVSQHWYFEGNPVDTFKDQLDNVAKISGKPVWLTEFGATGSDEDKSAFLKEVMPWMDSNDSIL